MNYRHSYHAGNFADVVKHLAEVAILLHLRKKEAPFAVIDSHAGRGLYDLSDAAAVATGEARNGIGRLSGLTEPLPETLGAYLKLVAECGANDGASAQAGATIKNYPGSPLIAAKLLRPQDRLAAIEKHPEEAAALAAVLKPWRKAAVETADGYGRLVKLLPPPERRGLILIDPPFEAADEFESLAKAVHGAFRRFATGIYLVWYPVKSESAADAFCAEVLAGGITKALRVEISVEAEAGKLGRAGLLVINPPYGFDGALGEILALLAPLLEARTHVDWLTGKA